MYYIYIYISHYIIIVYRVRISVIILHVMHFVYCIHTVMFSNDKVILVVHHSYRCLDHFLPIYLSIYLPNLT